MKIRPLLLALIVSVSVSAQDTASMAYKDSLIKVYKAKIVNARICIYNIQDYVNLCVANPKLNKFQPAWIQRILHDYYFQSGEVAPTRKSLKAERDANKKKKTTIKKK